MFGGQVSHQFSLFITLLLSLPSLPHLIPKALSFHSHREMATSVEQWRKSVPIFPPLSPDPPSYAAHRLSSTNSIEFLDEYLDLAYDAPPPYDQSLFPVKRLHGKRPRPISQTSHVEVDLKITGACPHCLFLMLRKTLKEWLRT